MQNYENGIDKFKRMPLRAFDIKADSSSTSAPIAGQPKATASNFSAVKTETSASAFYNKITADR